MMKTLTRMLMLAALAAAAACSSLGVQPWERDILARPEMALDANPVDTAFNEHLYFSKEATGGGRGFGGGGCGCN